MIIQSTCLIESWGFKLKVDQRFRDGVKLNPLPHLP